MLFLVTASLLAAVEVELLVFPDSAVVRVENGAGNARTVSPESVDRGGRGIWRRFTTAADDLFLVLSAPGYRDKRILIPDSAQTTLVIEERLEREGGGLTLVGEFPTGASPKAVEFLPDRRLVVTQLRGYGIDLLTIDGERRMVAIPPRNRAETGFVEVEVLPGRGEVWVTQMNTDAIHCLSLPTLSYRASVGTGGEWPKVALASPDERLIYVSNWIGESVGVIDTARRALVTVIPVGGTPRGMAFSDGGRYLWVCLYDSGDVAIIDTREVRVVDRIDLPDGAARHIVAGPSGRFMYLSDMYHGTISILDTATRTVVRTRRVGSNLNTIALSDDGELLFVSERGRNNAESYLEAGPVHGRIIVLRSDDLSTVEEVWGRNQPTGLAVSGNLVAATDFLDDNVALYLFGGVCR